MGSFHYKNDWHSTVKILAFVFISIIILMSCGGGGGGDGTGETGNTITPSSSKIEKVIDETGGTIIHSSGLSVDFPAGAFEQPILVSVEAINLPSPLPNGITMASDAYIINAEDVKLSRPATITFPGDNIDPSVTEGEVGIYRWDGNQWMFVGGGLEDNTISTSVDSFSPFIVGTGRSLHFPVEFDNFYVSEPVIVKVNRYVLSHPDLDAPISAANSAVVFPPPGNSPKGRMYLPQGVYDFCFEWSEEDIIEQKVIRYYAFYGSVPYNDPAAVLHENSSYVVPAYVSLDYLERYIGRCPVPQAWGGEGSVDGAQPSDFEGTYNALDPSRTSAAYRAIFTFNSNGTFTGTEWVNGVQGSVNGSWSYIPATQVFSMIAGGSMSGQIVGSINNFVLNGVWSNGSPGQLQLYR